jgi:hypothetical protein
MFSAHRAAGGMTSVYRQLGIGCERLFRQVLRDELELTENQVRWSYEYIEEDNNGERKNRTLTLDGRIKLLDVVDRKRRDRVEGWIRAKADQLGIIAPLNGVVFEVRQGYKSADSKRQNGDLTNAAQALGRLLLPSLVIMSTQINHVVRQRYELGNWAVMLGSIDTEDYLTSTFAFAKHIIGYDLAAFFVRNTEALRSETESILTALLEAK